MDLNSGSSLIVYEIVSILIQITAMILNGAIICTLWKKSLFQCPSNKFVFSLCLSQMLLSILSFSISVGQSFTTRSVTTRGGGNFLRALSSTDPDVRHPHLLTSIDPGEAVDFLGSQSGGNSGRSTLPGNYILSHFQLYAAFMVAVGGSLTIGLISIDRYITISLPMKYKSIVTPGRTTLAICLCWLVSALITLLPPLLIFGNETFVHGPIAIPKGALGLYFAIVFSIVTTIVLSVMIRCYNTIFKIAKEKCQKVQIGHFTSPVSSISSDWPSSAYSSHQGAMDRSGRTQALVSGSSGSESNSPVHRAAMTLLTPGQSRVNTNPSSLLHYVLLANLGKQTISGGDSTGVREPFMSNIVDPEVHSTKTVTVTLPSSPRSIKRTRTVIGPKLAASLLRQGTTTGLKKWRTFLQHNYKSPHKTVSTILTLIGSLTLTQLPLTLALFTATLFPALFYFSFKILLGFSAISSPILYGFLNRTIRVYLWKFLRIRKRYPTKGFNYIGSKTFDSRKASISSGSSQFFQPTMRRESVRNDITEHPIPVYPEEAKVQVDPGFEEDHSEFCEVKNIAKLQSSENEKLLGKAKEAKIEKILSNLHEMIPERSEFEPKLAPLCSIVIEEDNESNSSCLSSSFPRKPSQDSGADVSFSDDEEEVVRVQELDPVHDLCCTEGSTMRVRGGPRSPTSPQTGRDWSVGSGGIEVMLALAIGRGLHYADSEEVEDEDEDEVDFCSEPDDLFDFDEEDEQTFDRMKDIIKKKFSLTEEDLGTQNKNLACQDVIEPFTV